jgi:hypothetical protein
MLMVLLAKNPSVQSRTVIMTASLQIDLIDHQAICLGDIVHRNNEVVIVIKDRSCSCRSCEAAA